VLFSAASLKPVGCHQKEEEEEEEEKRKRRGEK
jgi:hypothetical protein